MTRLRCPELVTDPHGNAAIEFAILLPVMLLMLGSVVDFSLAFQAKGLLASSVAEGAQYAFLTGDKVTSPAIQGIVQQALSLPSGSVTVSAPSSGCITGLPAVLAPASYGSTCANGTAAARYITISARHTYVPVLPLYSTVASPTLTETATVRIQ